MFMSIVLATLIGAAIGGFTNLLAIRMLFRPYSQWQIGKWNVPFTPGLIPKRHEQLASQLGQLVTNHLLTSEGIKRAVEDRLKDRLLYMLQDNMKKLTLSDKTIHDFAVSWLGEEQAINLTNQLSTSMNDQMMNVLNRFLHNENWRSQTWGQWLPKYIPQQWEYQLKRKVAEGLQNGFIRFVEGGGLKQPLQSVIEQMTGGVQGMFGKLAAMFIDENKIAALIEPKIMEFLHKEELKNKIIDFLEEELSQIKNEEIGVTLDRYNLTEQLEKVAHNILINTSPGEYIVHVSISKLATPIYSLFEPISNHAFSFLWSLFVQKLEKALEVMELDQVVKREVLSFPLPKLEQIIVSIAAKELRMITWLGALLGGLIGIVQGVLFTILNS